MLTKAISFADSWDGLQTFKLAIKDYVTTLKVVLPGSKKHNDKVPLVEDEVMVYLQVGRAVWHVPRELRVELWLSSLQRKGVGSPLILRYQEFLHTEIPHEAAADIEKDIQRTYPNTKRFYSEEGQQSLRNVLRAYAAYDPEVAYCQGMNFVAGLLLMFMPSEAHAFAGLVILMEERGMRKYYTREMPLLQLHLWQLGKLLPAKLMHHLENVGAAPVIYAASWLMTAFSADFPIAFAGRIMDVLLANQCECALLKVAVTIVMICERKLLSIQCFEDSITFLKIEVPAFDEFDLHAVLNDAFTRPWSSRQLAILNSTEGAESVHQAMERVAACNPASCLGSEHGSSNSLSGEVVGKPHLPSLIASTHSSVDLGRSGTESPGVTTGPRGDLDRSLSAFGAEEKGSSSTGGDSGTSGMRKLGDTNFVSFRSSIPILKPPPSYVASPCTTPPGCAPRVGSSTSAQSVFSSPCVCFTDGEGRYVSTPSSRLGVQLPSGAGGIAVSTGVGGNQLSNATLLASGMVSKLSAGLFRTTSLTDATDWDPFWVDSDGIRHRWTTTDLESPAWAIPSGKPQSEAPEAIQQFRKSQLVSQIFEQQQRRLHFSAHRPSHRLAHQSFNGSHSAGGAGRQLRVNSNSPFALQLGLEPTGATGTGKPSLSPLGLAGVVASSLPKEDDGERKGEIISRPVSSGSLTIGGVDLLKGEAAVRQGSASTARAALAMDSAADEFVANVASSGDDQPRGVNPRNGEGRGTADCAIAPLSEGYAVKRSRHRRVRKVASSGGAGQESGKEPGLGSGSDTVDEDEMSSGLSGDDSLDEKESTDSDSGSEADEGDDVLAGELEWGEWRQASFVPPATARVLRGRHSRSASQVPITVIPESGTAPAESAPGVPLGDDSGALSSSCSALNKSRSFRSSGSRSGGALQRILSSSSKTGSYVLLHKFRMSDPGDEMVGSWDGSPAEGASLATAAAVTGINSSQVEEVAVSDTSAAVCSGSMNEGIAEDRGESSLLDGDVALLAHVHPASSSPPAPYSGSEEDAPLKVCGALGHEVYAAPAAFVDRQTAVESVSASARPPVTQITSLPSPSSLQQGEGQGDAPLAAGAPVLLTRSESRPGDLSNTPQLLASSSLLRGGSPSTPSHEDSSFRGPGCPASPAACQRVISLAASGTSEEDRGGAPAAGHAAQATDALTETAESASLTEAFVDRPADWNSCPQLPKTLSGAASIPAPCGHDERNVGDVNGTGVLRKPCYPVGYEERDGLPTPTTSLLGEPRLASAPDEHAQSLSSFDGVRTTATVESARKDSADWVKFSSDTEGEHMNTPAATSLSAVNVDNATLLSTARQGGPGAGSAGTTVVTATAASSISRCSTMSITGDDAPTSSSRVTGVGSSIRHALSGMTSAASSVASSRQVSGQFNVSGISSDPTAEVAEGMLQGHGRDAPSLDIDLYPSPVSGRFAQVVVGAADGGQSRSVGLAGDSSGRAREDLTEDKLGFIPEGKSEVAKPRPRPDVDHLGFGFETRGADFEAVGSAGERGEQDDEADVSAMAALDSRSPIVPVRSCLSPSSSTAGSFCSDETVEQDTGTRASELANVVLSLYDIPLQHEFNVHTHLGGGLNLLKHDASGAWTKADAMKAAPLPSNTDAKQTDVTAGGGPAAEAGVGAFSPFHAAEGSGLASASMPNNLHFSRTPSQTELPAVAAANSSLAPCTSATGNGYVKGPRPSPPSPFASPSAANVALASIVAGTGDGLPPASDFSRIAGGGLLKNSSAGSGSGTSPDASVLHCSPDRGLSVSALHLGRAASAAPLAATRCFSQLASTESNFSKLQPDQGELRRAFSVNRTSAAAVEKLLGFNQIDGAALGLGASNGVSGVAASARREGGKVALSASDSAHAPSSLKGEVPRANAFRESVAPGSSPALAVGAVSTAQTAFDLQGLGKALSSGSGKGAVAEPISRGTGALSAAFKAAREAAVTGVQDQEADVDLCCTSTPGSPGGIGCDILRALSVMNSGIALAAYDPKYKLAEGMYADSPTKEEVKLCESADGDTPSPLSRRSSQTPPSALFRAGSFGRRGSGGILSTAAAIVAGPSSSFRVTRQSSTGRGGDALGGSGSGLASLSSSYQAGPTSDGFLKSGRTSSSGAGGAGSHFAIPPPPAPLSTVGVTAAFNPQFPPPPSATTVASTTDNADAALQQQQPVELFEPDFALSSVSFSAKASYGASTGGATSTPILRTATDSKSLATESDGSCVGSDAETTREESNAAFCRPKTLNPGALKVTMAKLNSSLPHTAVPGLSTGSAAGGAAPLPQPTSPRAPEKPNSFDLLFQYTDPFTTESLNSSGGSGLVSGGFLMTGSKLHSTTAASTPVTGSPLKSSPGSMALANHFDNVGGAANQRYSTSNGGSIGYRASPAVAQSACLRRSFTTPFSCDADALTHVVESESSFFPATADRDTPSFIKQKGNNSKGSVTPVGLDRAEGQYNPIETLAAAAVAVAAENNNGDSRRGTATGLSLSPALTASVSRDPSFSNRHPRLSVSGGGAPPRDAGLGGSGLILGTNTASSLQTSTALPPLSTGAVNICSATGLGNSSSSKSNALKASADGGAAAGSSRRWSSCGGAPGGVNVRSRGGNDAEGTQHHQCQQGEMNEGATESFMKKAVIYVDGIPIFDPKSVMSSEPPKPLLATTLFSATPQFSSSPAYGNISGTYNHSDSADVRSVEGNHARDNSTEININYSALGSGLAAARRLAASLGGVHQPAAVAAAAAAVASFGSDDPASEAEEPLDLMMSESEDPQLSSGLMSLRPSLGGMAEDTGRVFGAMLSNAALNHSVGPPPPAAAPLMPLAAGTPVSTAANRPASPLPLPALSPIIPAVFTPSKRRSSLSDTLSSSSLSSASRLAFSPSPSQGGDGAQDPFPVPLSTPLCPAGSGSSPPLRSPASYSIPATWNSLGSRSASTHLDNLGAPWSTPRHLSASMTMPSSPVNHPMATPTLSDLQQQATSTEGNGLESGASSRRSSRGFARAASQDGTSGGGTAGEGAGPGASRFVDSFNLNLDTQLEQGSYLAYLRSVYAKEQEEKLSRNHDDDENRDLDLELSSPGKVSGDDGDGDQDAYQRSSPTQPVAARERAPGRALMDGDTFRGFSASSLSRGFPMGFGSGLDLAVKLEDAAAADDASGASSPRVLISSALLPRRTSVSSEVPEGTASTPGGIRRVSSAGDPSSQCDSPTAPVRAASPGPPRLLVTSPSNPTLRYSTTDVGEDFNDALVSEESTEQLSTILTLKDKRGLPSSQRAAAPTAGGNALSSSSVLSPSTKATPKTGFPGRVLPPRYSAEEDTDTVDVAASCEARGVVPFCDDSCSPTALASGVPEVDLRYGSSTSIASDVMDEGIDLQDQPQVGLLLSFASKQPPRPQVRTPQAGPVNRDAVGSPSSPIILSRSASTHVLPPHLVARDKSEEPESAGTHTTSPKSKPYESPHDGLTSGANTDSASASAESIRTGRLGQTAGSESDLVDVSLRGAVAAGEALSASGRSQLGGAQSGSGGWNLALSAPASRRNDLDLELRDFNGPRETEIASHDDGAAPSPSLRCDAPSLAALPQATTTKPTATNVGASSGEMLSSKLAQLGTGLALGGAAPPPPVVLSLHLSVQTGLDLIFHELNLQEG